MRTYLVLRTLTSTGRPFYFRFDEHGGPTENPVEAVMFKPTDVFLLQAEEAAARDYSHSGWHWERVRLTVTVEPLTSAEVAAIDQSLTANLRATALAKLTPRERATLGIVGPPPP